MSQFDSMPIPDNGSVDLSKAEPLSAKGSSCDVFRAIHCQRKVFVKKLKDKYAYSDEHRVAFAKEYCIGVEVGGHQALPVYYDYHPEPPVYIVMDYIDGDNIAELVRKEQGQIWLRDVGHIRRMLTQLVDVVDYLHQANVIHCDIKADNVMITRGTRNVMLIDLGNCYTDWLCYASGNPANYDLSADERGSIKMDFRGIAQIVEFLEQNVDGFPAKKFRRFHDLCFKPEVTPDELRKALEARKVSKLTIASIAVPLFIAAGIYIFTPPSKPETDIPPKQLIEPAALPATPTGLPDKLDFQEQVTPQPPKKEARRSYKEEIDRLLPDRLAPLNQKINESLAVVKDDSAQESEIRQILSEVIELSSTITYDAISEFKSKYPDVNPIEMEIAITGSKAYASMLEKFTELTALANKRLNPISADDID